MITLEPVYKFRSLNKGKQPNGRIPYNDTIDIITNNRLWFAHSDSFNDPYDCYIELINFSVTQKKFTQFVNGNNTINREARRKQAKDETLKIKYKKFIKSSFEEDYKGWGICSFSKEKKEILQWSHYAESHRGICIKFNPMKDDKDFNKSCFHNLLVNYPLEFKQKSWEKDKEEAIIHLLTTKAKNWEYEKEVRSFLEDRKNFPSGNRLRSFPKECLEEITFGINCDENDRKTIMNIVKKSGYINVNFSQAKMSENSFKIDFNNI